MQNWVNGTLDKYHQAASSFATTHNMANLDDVQVSGRTDERIVIVLNAVEFDGLQDVMRGQREVEKTVQDAHDQLKETQDQLTEAQASIRILKQQVQTLTQDRRTLPRGVKRTRNEEYENETIDEDEPQTHKRIRTRHGRKDNRIQRAFERLLRLRMGLAAKEDWPFFPNVDRSSSEWPREVPEVDMEDPDANIDPRLRDNVPLGAPLLRLDWIGGRMDDNQFSSVLADLSEELAENAEAHDLPDDPDKCTVQYIRSACKRTMVNIKRSARELQVKGAEVVEQEKAHKLRNDRRGGRHSTRLNARLAVADQNPLVFGAAAVAMVIPACVEKDESEDELQAEQSQEDDAEEERPARRKRDSVRAIIPEWWSQENKDLQARLDKEVPGSLSSYKIKGATHLQPHTKPLHTSIPRIAISSTWADAHPDLIRGVRKNPTPFKPERGALAANAEEFGSPITGLGVLEVGTPNNGSSDGD
ncbi:unnamed protein product [Tilletia controversa]|nr:unnamed protein product [Tilletia controversa]